MNPYLRRFKQSLQLKYNITLEVRYGDGVIGQIPVGVMAWNGLQAKKQAQKKAMKLLTIRAIASHRVKGMLIDHHVTLEVLFNDLLVGQVEITAPGWNRRLARKEAVEQIRRGAEVVAVDVKQYREQ